MSHDVLHDGHDDVPMGPPQYLKDRGGFGLPTGALMFVLVVILVAIAQGGQVVGWSSWGHIWPADHSGTVQLPPSNLSPYWRH